MDKTIWTPHFYGKCDLEVYLDRDFARGMVRTKVSAEKQKRMNELATEELKESGIRWLNPLRFYKDSGFVDQFYIGQNGVWLSINPNTLEEELSGESTKPIKYNSHNVDFQNQTCALLALFDRWIEYADVLKKD